MSDAPTNQTTEPQPLPAARQWAVVRSGFLVESIWDDRDEARSRAISLNLRGGIYEVKRLGLDGSMT